MTDPKLSRRPLAFRSAKWAAAMASCRVFKRLQPNPIFRFSLVFCRLAGMALVIPLMGFAGGLVLSANQQDRAGKIYGLQIEGRGGVMDRIYFIGFAAPVVFHLPRYSFT